MQLVRILTWCSIVLYTLGRKLWCYRTWGVVWIAFRSRSNFRFAAMKHALKISEPNTERTWHATAPLETTPGPPDSLEQSWYGEDIFCLPPIYMDDVTCVESLALMILNIKQSMLSESLLYAFSISQNIGPFCSLCRAKEN